MIDRLVIATKNRGKLAEISGILAEVGLAGEIVTGLDWPDVEETAETLEGNALLKAGAVVEATGLPALADDSGLEVSALAGRPGVHTARYAGPQVSYADNNAKLLNELSGVEDRSARFRTVVALVKQDGTQTTAEGSLEGRITETPRGSGGFGYDPVFEVDGRTLAEMGEAEKNHLSHRARALRALVEKLGR